MTTHRFTKSAEKCFNRWNFRCDPKAWRHICIFSQKTLWNYFIKFCNILYINITN